MEGVFDRKTLRTNQGTRAKHLKSQSEQPKPTPDTSKEHFENELSFSLRGHYHMKIDSPTIPWIAQTSKTD